MLEPIVFISNQRIKQGQLRPYQEYYQQVAELTKATKPGTVAHIAYASEDGTEVTIIHVFPDANAMEVHMKGVGDLAKKAFDFMEIVSFEIYGDPGEAVLAAMQRAAGSSPVPLLMKPQRLGGYIRLGTE